MDKMVGKIMKQGEKVAPVKSIKVKFQKVDDKKKEVAKKMGKPHKHGTANYISSLGK